MSEVPNYKLRPIKPLKITDLLPADIGKKEDEPKFEWVDPSALYVEERYQRNIAEKSISLIRKIYKDFQWSHMKPPVCSYGEGGKLFVIDGQHTAIAAASHPKIKKIPVMIVEANTIRERALSFMGHNRDRVAMTSAQLYYSAIAAGDPTALIVEKALGETGCTILRFNPPQYKEGQTMAAGSLLKLAERKGEKDLIRILKILMDAKRAPVIAIELNALADLLWAKEWKGKFTDYDLATVIRSKSAEAWQAWAKQHIIKGQAIPMKRALAIAWFKAVPKKKSDQHGIAIKTI